MVKTKATRRSCNFRTHVSSKCLPSDRSDTCQTSVRHLLVRRLPDSLSDACRTPVGDLPDTCRTIGKPVGQQASDICRETGRTAVGHLFDTCRSGACQTMCPTRVGHLPETWLTLVGHPPETWPTLDGLSGTCRTAGVRHILPENLSASPSDSCRAFV